MIALRSASYTPGRTGGEFCDAEVLRALKGGTYYAFQPNNGDAVHEYAAELASRYYREHRAILQRQRLDPAARSTRPGSASPVAFKCGPEENRTVWNAIAREFMGGVDLSAACPR
jgi:hypothetical protein